MRTAFVVSFVGMLHGIQQWLVWVWLCWKSAYGAVPPPPTQVYLATSDLYGYAMACKYLSLSPHLEFAFEGGSLVTLSMSVILITLSMGVILALLSSF